MRIELNVCFSLPEKGSEIRRTDGTTDSRFSAHLPINVLCCFDSDKFRFIFISDFDFEASYSAK